MDAFEFFRGEGRPEVGVFFREQLRRLVQRGLCHPLVAWLAAQPVHDAIRAVVRHAPLEPLDLSRGKPKLFTSLSNRD